MSPARTPTGATRGYIVPIGGAEDKLLDLEILRHFAELAGGNRARIAIIPTASELDTTGEFYRSIFQQLAAGEVHVLPFESRADCTRADWLAELEAATGIFLTGGNQVRLSTTLGGTPVAKLLRARNAAGVHVAGTSAGAAFMSEHMIANGNEGATPRAGMVTLAPGLGLTNRVIVDQHFRQRDRLGRLLTALAYNPFAIGIGLDEDSAAFLAPTNILTVMGSGAVTIVDPAGLTFSSMDMSNEDEPVCLIDVRLHVLVRGATFNLHLREATPPAPRTRGHGAEEPGAESKAQPGAPASDQPGAQLRELTP